MNLLDPDHPLLFSLPYQIDFCDQKTIIDYAYANTTSWNGQIRYSLNHKTNHDDNHLDSDDQDDYFGRVAITRLSDHSRKNLVPDYNSDWLNWAVRLDPTQEWEWIDTPITKLVKNYVDQVQHLYSRLHRVLVLVQRVGSGIPLHTDRVVKNTYQDVLFAPGPAKNLPVEPTDIHWQHNRYLALKWPLTEIDNNNGEPLVEINNQTYRYDVKNHCFAINEVDIKHGGRPTTHRRGVIFLDGILNYEALKKESWLPVYLKLVKS